MKEFMIILLIYMFGASIAWILVMWHIIHANYKVYDFEPFLPIFSWFGFIYLVSKIIYFKTDTAIMEYRKKRIIRKNLIDTFGNDYKAIENLYI